MSSTMNGVRKPTANPDSEPRSEARATPRRRPGNAWGDRVRALKNVPPVLHFVWESGPAVVFWNITIRIVVAFLPVGIGIIGRHTSSTA